MKLRSILIFFLLLFFLILTLVSSLSESPNVNEGHIATGFLYLRYGNLTFNAGSPILSDVISAVPLLLIEKSILMPQKKEYFEIGYVHPYVRDFFMLNKKNIDLILFLGRLPVMLAGVLLGVIVFSWIKQLYGYWIGILGLGLYILEPNIIVHSHYVATDIFFALFFTATLFFLQRFIFKKQKKYLALFIICFVAAQLTKITAIFLFPVCFFIFYFYSDKEKFVNKIKESFFKILILTFVSFVGINTFYLWRDIGLPLADYLKHDNSVRSSGYSINFIESKLPFYGKPIGKASEYLFNKFPLPVTYQYVKTLGWVFFRSNIPQQAFLAGHYFDNGWKLYFPLVTIIKMPITLLLLFCSSIILFFTKKRRLKKEEFVFVAIPFVIFVFILIFSKINTGYRLMIFLVPLIIILSIGTTKLLKRYSGLFLIAILFQFYITLANFPNFSGYANFIKDSEKYKYLTDSNIDWGQDIKRLSIYIKNNNVSSIKQNLYGILNTELYDVPYISFGPPWFRKKNEIEDCSEGGSGLYAVSASQLNGSSFKNHHCFDWLVNKGKLIKIIGSSIYIFKL